MRASASPGGRPERMGTPHRKSSTHARVLKVPQATSSVRRLLSFSCSLASSPATRREAEGCCRPAPCAVAEAKSAEQTLTGNARLDELAASKLSQSTVALLQRLLARNMRKRLTACQACMMLHEEAAEEVQELPVFEKAVTALSMTLAATGGADRGSHVGLASIDESEDLEELMQSAVEGSSSFAGGAPTAPTSDLAGGYSSGHARPPPPPGGAGPAPLPLESSPTPTPPTSPTSITAGTGGGAVSTAECVGACWPLQPCTSEDTLYTPVPTSTAPKVKAGMDAVGRPSCRGITVPVVAGVEREMLLHGCGLMGMGWYSVFAYVESYDALDNDGSLYGPLRFQVPATSNSFAASALGREPLPPRGSTSLRRAKYPEVPPEIQMPVTKDGLAVTFTPTASAGWGYAMIAAEADYATLTVANVKAFMSAVGDASCKWNDFASTMGNTVNLTSCRLYGGQKYRLFVYDGHVKNDGVLAEPMEVMVPPSNSFAGMYPYPTLAATPTPSQVSIELEPREAGMAWAVVIPELEAISATVASIKAATGAMCSTASVALTSGMQSFTIDSCALSLEVLYKAMVYIEDGMAENDGSFAAVDVMVPSNGTTNAFSAYPKLVSIAGAVASSDGVTFTVTASGADGRLWAMVVPDYIENCMTVRNRS
eukprot:s6493_g5.t1